MFLPTAHLMQPLAPNPLRWDPLPLPTAPTDFVDGLLPVAENGSPESHAGCGIYLYAANQSMRNRYFYSADGELLIVPQLGTLELNTELGRIDLEPQEVAVIPRGLRFRVDVQAGAARGYICENFGAPFRLPDLGPIGSNGLANPRDFLAPRARYEDIEGRLRADRKVSRPAVDCANGPFAARCRRVAWQRRALQIRPTPLQHPRFDFVRPSRPVDLLGAALAERLSRHQQHRLRRLSAALARDAKLLPPALVPPQYSQRIHGLDHWCVRRKEPPASCRAEPHCTTA